MMMDLKKPQQRTKLAEINSHLTCNLCKGYLIDATTISECLHSFCRSCIIKFLQDNSHCPVCEVMINKAKPNIKLDKTLQDIVYKLVPELFVLEMARRRSFYRNHPVEAAKATPEERGEDTERTIFNPKDTISLSIEYIRDDSTPGAIQLPVTSKTESKTDQDSTIRRFLQCPGMCRVDVLKKFVRNKYNVDTNLFYIDILYKRVPLPDHYTLIDIAYIYSWKRNEPMKFFFRITDVNSPDNFDFAIPLPIIPEAAANTVKQKTSKQKKSLVNKSKTVEVKKDDVRKDAVITEEIKSRIQSEPENEKNVYTNITLNRSNNVEIITKIQKVSNKIGQPIGLNIMKKTVKKADDKQKSPEPKKTEVETKKPEHETNKQTEANRIETTKTIEATTTTTTTQIKPEVTSNIDYDLEKSNFLKSIELTAKTNVKAERVNNSKEITSCSIISKLLPNLKSFSGNLDSTATCSSPKRKNPSPKSHSEKQAKKPKLERTSPIRSKGIQNPAVRQMVSNVNQNVCTLTKIVEQNSPNKELKTLFDACKINIPSSLSITIKDDVKQKSSCSSIGPVSLLKPVKNFIEILKLPEEKEELMELKELREWKLEEPRELIELKQQNERKKELISKEKLNPKSPQTFQKMFEEAIKKPEFTGKFQLTTDKKPLDLSPDLPSNKQQRDSQQQPPSKKPRVEQHNGKVAIPRLKSPKLNLHSPSLGMNYTVSVESKHNHHHSHHQEQQVPLSPNQLLEKYNIQNLAQLTASFNFNAAGFGQLAALQQAMIYKHFEMQNRQNWLSMNPNPVVQYEKYLQSLQQSGKQQLLGNVKEN